LAWKKLKINFILKYHLNKTTTYRPKQNYYAGNIIPTGQPGAGIDAVAVVQEPWGRLGYDAWGLAFKAGTVSSSGTPPGEVENQKDKFTYNGKELLTDLDLSWND
jgi:hypothetical protein